MASDSPPSHVASAIGELAREKLRSEYLFMKTESLERLVDQVVDSLEEGIRREEPAMAESKARTNFFSLPIELRDYIYGLALEIQIGGMKRIRPPELSHRNTKASYPWERYRSNDWTGYALDAVSHQVRTEARAAYYGQQSFHLIIPGSIIGVHEAGDWYTRFIRRLVTPYGAIFKELHFLFNGQSQIEVANYVWLKHCSGEIVDRDILRWGPAPLVTNDMVVSSLPMEEWGVSIPKVTVWFKDGRSKCRKAEDFLMDNW